MVDHLTSLLYVLLPWNWKTESEDVSIFAASRDQPISSGSNRLAAIAGRTGFAQDSSLEEAGFELPVPLARMSSILRGGEEAELDRGGLETRHPLSTGMIGSNRWHRLPDAGRRAGRGADRLDSQLRAL